nr:hypothetical protein [Saccharopolyspora sp. HNM0983]
MRTGCGPTRAGAAVRSLRRRDFGALVVAGVAGGLDDSVRSGDVIVADELRAPGGVLSCPSAPLLAGEIRRVLAAAEPHGRARVRCGPIATAHRIVHGSRRRELASGGALAVDLESAVLARAARERPLGVVRVVVDTARQPLAAPGTPGRGMAALRRLRALAPAVVRWHQATGPRRLVDPAGHPELVLTTRFGDGSGQPVCEVGDVALSWLAGVRELSVVAADAATAARFTDALRGLGPVEGEPYRGAVETTS